MAWAGIAASTDLVAAPRGLPRAGSRRGWAASRLPLVLAVTVLLISTSAGWAAQPGSGPPPASPKADAKPAPPDRFGRETPRGTVTGYLEAAAAGDYVTAAEYLDLRRLPADRRAAEGPAVARQLKLVLDRRGLIDRWALSDDPDGTLHDGLPPDRDRVGELAVEGRQLDLTLVRVSAGDAGAVWQFSSETLSHARTLAAAIRSHPIERFLPERLVGIKILDVALWQWLALGVAILLAVLLSWLVGRAISLLARALVRRTPASRWGRLLDAALAPLRLLLATSIFGIGLFTLGISIFARQYLGRAVELLILASLAWLVVRLLDVASDLTISWLVGRGRQAALSVVPLGRRAAKAVILALFLLLGLASLGFNLTPALAALGGGGLAVALAAQKTIENLFGGLTLIADRPVRVGDFCRFGDKIGTVEDIGMRSTRIRTLDRTVVTIPNADFVSLALENFGQRDRFWFHPTIGLRYETTPDQIRFLLVEIRSMLYAHPRVSPDPARVRFVGFGDSSLNLEIFAYVHAADFSEFLEVQEDLLLRIMDIVAEAGSSIAFPSRTLYLRRDAGLGEKEQQAAGTTVKQWQESGELQLPRFTPERIQRLRGTLPYPPPGSASGTDKQ